MPLPVSYKCCTGASTGVDGIMHGRPPIMACLCMNSFNHVVTICLAINLLRYRYKPVLLIKLQYQCITFPYSMSGRQMPPRVI